MDCLGRLLLMHLITPWVFLPRRSRSKCGDRRLSDEDFSGVWSFDVSFHLSMLSLHSTVPVTPS